MHPKPAKLAKGGITASTLFEKAKGNLPSTENFPAVSPLIIIFVLLTLFLLRFDSKSPF